MDKEELTKVLLEKKEKLDVNLEYVKAKEKELEQRLKELSEQKDKNDKTQREIDDRETVLKNLNEELRSKQHAFQNIDETLKAKESEIDEKSKEVTKLILKISELEKKAGIDIDETLKSMDEYKKIIIREQSEKTSLQFELKSLKSELSNTKSALGKEEEKCESLLKENNEYVSLIESIKEKNRNTAQLISEMAKLRLEQAKEREEFDTQLNKKDIYISELKSRIAELEKEDAAKRKEIEYLRGIEKTLIEECQVNLHFPILPPEDTETEAENQSLKAKIEELETSLAQKEKMSRESKSLAESYLDKLEAAKLELHEYKARCVSEFNEKNGKIKELEDLLIAKEGLLERPESPLEPSPELLNKLGEYQNQIATLNQILAEERAKQNEMRDEIEILITQCKEAHAQLKSRDGQLKKQSIALQQFETILQEKDAEIQKREQYLVRMTKQLEEKKEQLHVANIKMKQMSKSALAELKVKASEKDKELKMLKGMVKGHHLEMEAKNKDLARMRKEVKRLRQTNQMKGEFIRTFVNVEDEEQVKQLEKLEELENEDISDNERGSKSRKHSFVEHKSSHSKKRSDVKLPAISQTEDAESRRKTPKKMQYSERYLQKVDSYSQIIADPSFHNNSTNIHGILSQNYNVFSNVVKGKYSHSPSQSSEALTPLKQRQKDLDLHVDVNEIIRRSIGGKVTNGPNAGHMKVGNLKAGGIQRVKIRKNSKI